MNMTVYWIIPNGMLYGGIKKMIENAEGLQFSGMKSVIIMRHDDYDPSEWYGTISVPIYGEKYFKEHVTEKDFIVLTWKDDIDLIRCGGAKTIFYCQDVNHENQNDNLDAMISNVDKIVLTTNYLYEFLNSNYLLSNVRAATKITYGINTSIFYDDDRCRTNRAIFIPRKTKGMRTIVNLWTLQDRYLSLESIGGMPGGNYGDGSTLLTPRQLADEYRKSYVYVTASASEPFGLTPLEAMACGVISVGWDGKGGKEYMRDGVNCIVANNGDKDSLLEKIERVNYLAKNRASRLDKMRREAIATAKSFSLSREREAWYAYIKGLI